MLTIKMNAYKDLVITTQAKLYQRESIVDKIQFIVNAEYNDIDMTPFTATLEYIDPANNAHAEILEKAADGELYKEKFIRYILPIDSRLTYLAGTITLKITFSYQDSETEESYIMRSGELELEINKLNDYFVYTDNASFDKITNKMLELKTETEKLAAVADRYAENQVDDITLTDDLLQVTASGVKKGEGVVIAVPPNDVDANPYDGIIDLDDDGVPSGGSDSGIPIIDLGG